MLGGGAYGGQSHGHSAPGGKIDRPAHGQHHDLDFGGVGSKGFKGWNHAFQGFAGSVGQNHRHLIRAFPVPHYLYSD